MSTADSPIGARGPVTSTGAIRPGRTGEVMLAIRGGVEAFMARDVDGGAIEPYTEVVVIDYEPSRVVIASEYRSSARSSSRCCGRSRPPTRR